MESIVTARCMRRLRVLKSEPTALFYGSNEAISDEATHPESPETDGASDAPREEATESFNELARTVVDQELRGAIVICEKLTQRENGVYVSYVALELSGEKFASKYNEKISEDERIMAEYNYERFKETFQEEMNKLGN